METGYKSLRSKKRIRTRTNRTQRGRELGSKNKATIQKEALAEIARRPNGKLAVEVMDEEIEAFERLEKVLYPWDEAGQFIKGKSANAYYWACEMRRDYLSLRAPYQSPRLSAVQVVSSQQGKRITEVNVTILNEKGDTEYSDVPDDDPKLIEGTVGQEPTEGQEDTVGQVIRESDTDHGEAA